MPKLTHFHVPVFLNLQWASIPSDESHASFAAANDVCATPRPAGGFQCPCLRGDHQWFSPGPSGLPLEPHRISAL